MFTSLFRRSVKIYYRNQVSFLSTQEKLNIVVTHLDLNHDTEKINKLKEIDISNISKEKLIQNCKTIKAMNVNIDNVKNLEHCLALSPSVMKSRILTLKEMGARNLSLLHVQRFPTTMRRTVKHFKKCHNIPEEENIMANILNNVGLKVDKSILDKFEYNIQMGVYYTLCMMYFKTFCLELHGKKFFVTKKRRYQSFKELTEVIATLRAKYELNGKFLHDHNYLINQRKTNIERYFTECKDLNNMCNKNIKEMVKKYPRLLCHPIDKVKELIILCKELGISFHSVIIFMSVLNMKKEVFVSRYMSILNNLELRIWAEHPRLLYLIYYYNTVVIRLEFLKATNLVHLANISTFLSKEEFFMRFVRGDAFYKVYKRTLLYLLGKELKTINIDSLNKITQHRHWQHVSLLMVAETIEYLKQYYSADDICKNIHIVLYPKSVIMKAFDKVHTDYTSEVKNSFTSSQYLALCLYILEKKYHFNGDAIWEERDTQTKKIEDINVDKLKKVIRQRVDDSAIACGRTEIAWFVYLLK